MGSICDSGDGRFVPQLVHGGRRRLPQLVRDGRRRPAADEARGSTWAAIRLQEWRDVDCGHYEEGLLEGPVSVRRPARSLALRDGRFLLEISMASSKPYYFRTLYSLGRMIVIESDVLADGHTSC